MKKETIIPESRDPAFRDAVLKTPVGEKIQLACNAGYAQVPARSAMKWIIRHASLYAWYSLALRKKCSPAIRSGFVQPVFHVQSVVQGEFIPQNLWKR